MSKVLKIVYGIILLATLFAVVKLYNDQPKVAYVDLVEVFQSFELKQELEEKLEQKVAGNKVRLDSLKVMLNNFMSNEENKGDIQKLQYAQLQFQNHEEKMVLENTELTQKYDQQVKEQLNEYVKQFGAENNYTLLFGLTGEGTLMYAEEANEVTEEVIEYINKKYNGN